MNQRSIIYDVILFDMGFSSKTCGENFVSCQHICILFCFVWLMLSKMMFLLYPFWPRKSTHFLWQWVKQITVNTQAIDTQTKARNLKQCRFPRDQCSYPMKVIYSHIFAKSTTFHLFSAHFRTSDTNYPWCKARQYAMTSRRHFELPHVRC